MNDFIFKSISVQKWEENGTRYCRGMCPFCETDLEADAHYGDEKNAILAAKNKVWAHIEIEHKDKIKC